MKQKQYEQLLSTWDEFTVPEWGFWTTLKENRLVFVTEVGDCPLRHIFIKGVVKRDYVNGINSVLKKEGKQTIGFVTSENSLRGYLTHIYSRDFRFIHQVEGRKAG